MRRLIVLIALVGCSADGDGDGFASDVDCDDSNASIFPGATEHCDGVDENCDGQGDDGAVDGVAFFGDSDGDGVGGLTDVVIACEAPTGFAAVGGDCDDADPGAFPGATETCNGVDDDCDGEVDDGAGDAATFYVDADGDGYGDAGQPVLACSQPPWASVDSTDCDDGQDDVHPGADEWCNGVDDDCNGTVDDNSALDAIAWYADADLDGFGAGAPTLACALAGGSPIDGDCDDTRPAAYPGADETCNGQDDDCDGVPDEDAVDGAWYYGDVDGDGYGNPALDEWACAAPPGSVSNADDCDDFNAANNPLADERCDGVDNNCDTLVDGIDAIDPTWWFDDLDGDGWGAIGTEVQACNGTVDQVPVGWDCDDGDANISPIALEDCANGVDDDCNGLVDDCGGSPAPGGVFAIDDSGIRYDGAASSSAGLDGDVAGDIDGDGFDDLIIGGPNYSTTYSNLGAAWLVYGSATPTGGALTAEPMWVHPNQTSRLGWRVSGLGDIDGDGFDDFGLGSEDTGFSRGALYVHYGGAARFSGVQDPTVTAAAVFEDNVNNDPFPTGLSRAGDVDGDGFDDFVMGSWTYAESGQEGAVYLVYGNATRLSGTIDLNTLPRLVGQSLDELPFEKRSAGRGDFDGDGLSDIAIGNRRSNFPRVYVWYGDPVQLPAGSSYLSTAPTFTMPSGTIERLGECTTGIGDLDGDGYEDLAFSSTLWDGPGNDDGLLLVQSGGATRWAGATDAETNATYRVEGLAQEGLGSAIAGPTDLDGDGTDDLIVSASSWDAPLFSDGGTVATFYGAPGLTGMVQTDDATLRFEGVSVGSGLGYALSSGDVDGDGAADLWATSPGYGSGGAGWLLLGADL